MTSQVVGMRSIWYNQRLQTNSTQHAAALEVATVGTLLRKTLALQKTKQKKEKKEKNPKKELYIYISEKLEFPNDELRWPARGFH